MCSLFKLFFKKIKSVKEIKKINEKYLIFICIFFPAKKKERKGPAVNNLLVSEIEKNKLELYYLEKTCQQI